MLINKFASNEGLILSRPFTQAMMRQNSRILSNSVPMTCIAIVGGELNAYCPDRRKLMGRRTVANDIPGVEIFRSSQGLPIYSSGSAKKRLPQMRPKLRGILYE
jgi:hypothetical protein